MPRVDGPDSSATRSIASLASVALVFAAGPASRRTNRLLNRRAAHGAVHRSSGVAAAVDAMIASFKEFVLPYLIYLMVMGACAFAVFRSTPPTLFLYVVLVVFPQFWYPTQELPLGTQTLTLLVVSILVGNWRRPQPDTAAAPQTALIMVILFYTFLGLWLVSFRFNLSLPISGANPVLADWKNYALMLTLYFAAYRTLRDEAQIRTLVMLMAAVLLLTSIREYRNFYGGDSFSYSRRASGTFGMLGMGANHFGAFVGNVAALCLGLFAMNRNGKPRWLYGMAFVGALYPLFYSYSRGAYAAVLLAAAAVGVIRYRVIIVLLLGLGVFWESILPESVVERMQMTESPDGEIEESAAMRLVVWDLAQKLFAESPLFGIGFQGFFFASDGLPLRNVHNYFYQVAAEQGVIGVLLLALVFLAALRSGWRLYRSGGSDVLRGVGLGFLAYTLSMGVTNVFGDRYSQLEMGSYFWILFGAVARANRLAGAMPGAGAGKEPLQEPRYS